MEEVLEFVYRKPEDIVSLVYRELGEAPSEKATTITRILWRHAFTLEQVQNALKTLEERGRAKKLHDPKWEPNPKDPQWCQIWYDDEDDL